MKRKILIAVLSFVLLFVGFIPVMNASTVYYEPVECNDQVLDNLYINTNVSNEYIINAIDEIEALTLGTQNGTLYLILQLFDANQNEALRMGILKMYGQNMVGAYSIFITGLEGGNETYYIYTYENGWDYEFLNLLVEAFGTYENGIYNFDFENRGLTFYSQSIFVGNDYEEEIGTYNYLINEVIYQDVVISEEAPTYTPLVFNIFETIGNIATGFGGLVVSLFTSAFNLIYNNGTLTTLGIIILISLATGLLIWAFVYIRRLIKIRSK